MRPSPQFSLFLALLLATSASAAEKLDIGRLGKYTVGSALEDVRQYRAGEACVIERGMADCVFTDPDGVEYLVLDDAVIAVTANAKTASPRLKLPFGLRFGDSIDAAMPRLVVGHRIWLLATHVVQGFVISSYEQYAGVNGGEFNVEAKFEYGRLVEIKYNSGTI